MDATPRRNPVLPLVAAWLVPGAGHFVIGRPWPGVFVAAAVLPVFGAGMALSGFENVHWDRHPWMFGLQVLTGLPAGIGALATRDHVPTEHFRHDTVGDLYTCVAGLLNLVAIADVWARCAAGDPEERIAAKAAEEADDAGTESDASSLVAGDPAATPQGGPGADPSGSRAP